MAEADADEEDDEDPNVKAANSHTILCLAFRTGVVSTNKFILLLPDTHSKSTQADGFGESTVLWYLFLDHSIYTVSEMHMMAHQRIVYGQRRHWRSL